MWLLLVNISTIITNINIGARIEVLAEAHHGVGDAVEDDQPVMPENKICLCVFLLYSIAVCCVGVT